QSLCVWICCVKALSTKLKHHRRAIRLHAAVRQLTDRNSKRHFLRTHLPEPPSTSCRWPRLVHGSAPLGCNRPLIHVTNRDTGLQRTVIDEQCFQLHNSPAMRKTCWYNSSLMKKP